MNGWMGALFYMLEAKVVWSRAGDAMTTWRLHAPYWATAPQPRRCSCPPLLPGRRSGSGGASRPDTPQRQTNHERTFNPDRLMGADPAHLNALLEDTMSDFEP